MDTTASEIIVQAFRDAGFLDGKPASTAEELHEALPVLNRLLMGLVGLELGERYSDWPVPPSRTSTIHARYPLAPLNQEPTADQWQHPPSNVRIVTKNSEAVTIYLPYEPEDGARVALADVGASAAVTMHANGKLIQGTPYITGQGGIRRWFYRADMGNWVCLTPLEMHHEMPLPQDFDDLFITGLIKRLSPRYKVPVDPEVQGRYEDMLSRLKKRYRQTQAQPVAGSYDFPSSTLP